MCGIRIKEGDSRGGNRSNQRRLYKFDNPALFCGALPGKANRLLRSERF